MPLIFAENEDTESGIRYDDRTGVSYQFPPNYRKTIQPGERFIYYRGRKKRGGGRIPQVYFGVGVVGDVTPEANGRFTCRVLDYRPFLVPIPFKDKEGHYLETSAGRRGYFQRGVRTVSEAEFQRILQMAESGDSAAGDQAEIVHPPRSISTGYATPEAAKEVDAFAMRTAVKELGRRYLGAIMEVQPPNNPGFDILVRTGGRILYVEVKGTRSPTPRFYLSDGELRVSQCCSANFLLLVVYGIDIASRSYQMFWHEGAIGGARFLLRPIQWACEPRTPPSNRP